MKALFTLAACLLFLPKFSKSHSFGCNVTKASAKVSHEKFKFEDFFQGIESRKFYRFNDTRYLRFDRNFACRTDDLTNIVRFELSQNSKFLTMFVPMRAVCDKFSFSKDNEGYLQARGMRSEVTVYYTFGLYLDQKSNRRVYYKYYTPKMQFQEFFLQDLMAGDILNRTVNNFRECFNVSAVELDLLEQHLNGSSRFNFGRLAILFVLLNVMVVISNKFC